MYFKGHFQNAYVTHNLDKALEGIDQRFGKIDWIVFEPDMILKTPMGDKESSVRAALGWHDGHQLEVIQPVKGYLDHYLPALPADTNDHTPPLPPHRRAPRRRGGDARGDCPAEPAAAVRRLGARAGVHLP